MSKSHNTTRKTVHTMWVYPQEGNPHRELFSTEEKAREFQKNANYKTSYGGKERLNFTDEYPIYDKNVYHTSEIDYRVE